LDLLLDGVLRYPLPQMKAIILSALIAATLAISASAQDYGSLILNHQIAVGMTYEGVIAAWGERESVVRTPPDIELWIMKNGWVVVFQNGKVASFYSKADAVKACLVYANAAESE
jgi:hypothetical protein